MDNRDGLPIACTLQPGSHQARLAWIAALARDGLHGVSREGLCLELRYTPAVAARVRDMVRKEQECCGFLCFELRESAEGVRLTIVVPERGRSVADTLFEQFVPAGVATTSKSAAREDAQPQRPQTTAPVAVARSQAIERAAVTLACRSL